MNTCKLTFLGDMTCDRRMLRAAVKPDGSFDFGPSLANVPETCRDSDYVVGNLETVFAGDSIGFNPYPVAYNSPIALLDAFDAIGVDMLTTGNNHCLDMGKKGLRRTVRELDKREIAHTGTVKKAGEKNYAVVTVNGIRIAIVAFADGVNKTVAGIVRSASELALVNHLKGFPKRTFSDFVKNLIGSTPAALKKEEAKADKKRKAGIKLVKAHVDNDPITPADEIQLEKAIALLKKAREESDVVIASVHAGGQFNGEPGTRCRAIYERLYPYADAFIGNHAHVAQKAGFTDGKLLCYALGGLNMSCGAAYVTKDDHPEYSMGVHLYLSGENGAVKVDRATFSFYYNEEDENGYLTVYPVTEAGGKGDTAEMRTVFQRITGRAFTEFRKEYELN